MANTNVKELTDRNFKAEVLQADVPTLVDFWATWCPPCKAIAPLIETIADRYKGRLKVGKLDIDKHEEAAQRYDVRSIPTLLIFKNGKVVGQIVGAVPQSKLESEIKKHL